MPSSGGVDRCVCQREQGGASRCSRLCIRQCGNDRGPFYVQRVVIRPCVRLLHWRRRNRVRFAVLDRRHTAELDDSPDRSLSNQ